MMKNGHVGWLTPGTQLVAMEGHDSAIRIIADRKAESIYLRLIRFHCPAALEMLP